MLRRQFLGSVAVCFIRGSGPSAQKPIDPKELAAYRLTEPVFKRFAHATRLIAKVARDNPDVQREPLITREIAVGGDAAEMVKVLEDRLDGDAAYAAALFAADIGAREYSAFAIALLAARLAHGFVKSGAMRRVPAGVPTDNVAFIDQHEREVAALLKELSLE